MASPSTSRPTLALAMIVRDEAHNLEQWLPQARPFLDELVVVDTGSRDDTVALLRELDASVYEYAWEDNFSRSRNRGLEHVTADWILVLDADENVSQEDWEHILELIQHNDVLAYSIQVKNYHAVDDLTSFDLMTSYRLFRNGHGIRYEGAVHNQLAGAIERAAGESGLRIEAAPIVVHHYGYALGPEAMRAKRERIYSMVRHAVEEHPGDSFYLFHMLSICHAMGRYQEARKIVAELPFETLRPELRVKALAKAAQVSLFFDAFDVANAYVRDALTESPELPFLHHLESQILYQMGRYSDGIRAAYRAIDAAQKGPTGGESIFLSLDQLLANLAMGYLLSGDLKSAEWHLQQALTINPTNYDARTWMSKLEEMQTA
jgi:glycosyltransferase involved in cell wall biosynthesis